MPWYGGASLVETLDRTIRPSAPPVHKPLRACVQDVYEIDGKEIVVCKILTGTLEKGEVVNFDPSGEEGLVIQIEMLGRKVEKAEAGDSVGLVLDKPVEAKRGQVISYPRSRAKVVQSFIAEIVLFSSIEVRNDDVLMIRCGTAEKRCKVQRILERIDPINLTVDARSPETLKSREVGRIILLPLEPICMEKYSEFPELGRFVVEGKSGTVAAGIVLKT